MSFNPVNANAGNTLSWFAFSVTTCLYFSQCQGVHERIKAASPGPMHDFGNVFQFILEVIETSM
jgi:hypothetical protein